MPKDFTFRGKNLEEIQKMSLKEFAKLLSARQRRSLLHGLTEQQKKLVKKLKEEKSPIKTHLRNMIIIPEMIGKRIQLYNGKTFVQIQITQDMLGHYLGEFVLTRKKVEHSAPGIGATKSSAAISVR